MRLGDFEIKFYSQSRREIRLRHGELDRYFQGSVFELPRGIGSLNSDLKPPVPVHYLKISTPLRMGWRPYRFAGEGRLSFRYSPGESGSPSRVVVVYFINTYISASYLGLLKSQMKDLKRCGLMSSRDVILNLVVLGDSRVSSEVEATMARLGMHSYRMSVFEENNHEYHGIRLAHQMALEHPESYILYFHGKGISHKKKSSPFSHRTKLERRLFSKVVGEWRRNIAWLDRIASMDKVAMYCGLSGMGWYNFWWAKSGYLRGVEPPVLTDDRYYYESWLGLYADASDPRGGLQLDTNHRCGSIYSSPRDNHFCTGTNYSPESGNTGWNTRHILKSIYYDRLSSK